jgi:Mn2+/Fe2+ NRAMP family transporter
MGNFLEYLIALAWLVLPWLFLLWLFALILQMVFYVKRDLYGASVGLKLAYAWSAFCLSLILAVDVLVLVLLSRVPGWTAITPQATYIAAGLIVSGVLWSSLRADLRGSQIPLRKAQQGARA